MSDETPSGIPSHRPLPSVDMPLLRDHVRQTRRRSVLAGSVLLAVGLVAAALAWWRADDGTAPSASPAPAEAALPVPVEVGFTPPVDAGPAPLDGGAAATPSAPLRVEPTEVPGGTRTTHAFGQALGFRPALTNAGLEGREADAVTVALTDVMDFRRCRPEHQMTVERDADGRAQRFEYRASITHIYEAVRRDDRWIGRRVDVPVERVRRARGGVVQNSLGGALEQAGLGRSMVGTFVDTFDGRFDFNTETRGGDTFRVLVDEERIGDHSLGFGTVWAIEYRSQRRGLLQAFWVETRPGEGDFHDETGRAVHGGWLRTPLRFDHISSPFNPRRMHPVLRRIMPHNGIDYAAGVGVPVWAAGDGTVTFAGERGANGNLVSLRHDGGYESFYAHLSRFAPGLAAGRPVRQRQLIGYVGSTGRSTGPHLHFGLKRNGRFVDPGRELNGPGRALPAAQMARFRSQMARLRGELASIELPDVQAATDRETSAPSDATPRDEGGMD